MAVHIAPEYSPQTSSAPDTGKHVSLNKATALPATNGVASAEEDFGTTRAANPAAASSLENEQAQAASFDARKRDIAEFCDQPESKRVKRSLTRSQNSSTNTANDASKAGGSIDNSFDKDSWQGFCEIESEPAYFSTILRDMGVQGINVREVFSMEPWFLETLPTPIHGLILLYRYRTHNSSGQPTEASKHVWFANQLPAQNSCATLAMINILMNSIDAEIGEHLQQFKDFTKDFTPYQRGETFASFDFIKKIHNSFAKKMDILEADKHLLYKANKAQRLLKGKKARRKSTDSAATDDSAENYEDNAHHFIAFVPVGNEVWQLDGLDAQPTSMTTFDTERGETWLSTAADSISSIMAGGGDNYTGFAITRSPLLSLCKQACLAINTVRYIESRLDAISPDWKSFTVDESTPPHPQMLGVENLMAEHTVPETLAATIAGEEMADLLERRSRVVKDLDQVAASIVSEKQTETEDAQKAAQRRYDCGPVIKMWAEMLAGNGYLEANLDRFMPATTREKKAKK